LSAPILRRWPRPGKSAYDSNDAGPLSGSFFAETCPPRVRPARRRAFLFPAGCK